MVGRVARVTRGLNAGEGLPPSGPFHRFVAAATISLYGDQITSVALLVLLYQVTGSIEAPAAYLLAKQLPRIAGIPVGGDVADRLSPQTVMALSALVQGALVGGVVVASQRGSATTIYVLVVVGQFAAGMGRAATGAVMPRIVPAERLSRANTIYQLFLNSGFVLAPMVAAPLLAWQGPQALLVADMGTFAVSAALVVGVPTLMEPAVDSRAREAGLLAGVRTVMAQPFLRVLAMTTMAEGIVVSVASSTFVPMATERLGGYGDVALLYAFVGIGDVLGALLLLRKPVSRAGRATVAVPGIICVGGIAFLAFAHSLRSAAPPLLVCGAAGVTFHTLGLAEAQRSTGRDVMGRVSAVLVMASAVGLMTGAALQIVLLGLTRWDVTLCAVAGSTAVVLAVAATLSGPFRSSPARL